MPPLTDVGRGGNEASGFEHYALAASAAELDPKPRGIYCEADGVITVEDPEAVALTYTMTAGQVLSFRAHKVTDVGAGTFYAWH